MVTASHNPAEYNGLKISAEKAVPIGFENGLDLIEKKIMSGKLPEKSETPGKVEKKNILNAYIKYARGFLNLNRKLKIAVDTGNGMKGLTLPYFFEGLDIELVKLFWEIDCSFPNHEANPLVIENTLDLQKSVVDSGSDFGIAFDGDGDRAMFIDDKGNYISSDLLGALIAAHFLKKEKSKILYDIRSSKTVAEHIRANGGEPIMWRVGHAFMKRKMREENAIFGCELSGHYYFRDNFCADSGLISAAILTTIVSSQNKKLSELIAPLKRYSFSGELNFKVDDKEKVIELLKEKYKPMNFYDFDGIRMEFENWWFNVRPSNTEPYLRLVVETANDEMLKEKIEEIKNIICRKF